MKLNLIKRIHLEFKSISVSNQSHHCIYHSWTKELEYFLMITILLRNISSMSWLGNAWI